tara:strand:- start:7014 stop:9188 length:2175 start_codon:yes stop_codon:yes gene_type:complete
MVDVSSLVIRVDSKEVKIAGSELQKFAKSGGKAENQTKKLGRSSDKLKSSFIGLRGAAASLGVAMAFRQVVKAADTFQLLNARIALVTDSTKEAESVYGDLLAMSQRTGSALESSITLYTRMARATDNLGLSNRQLLTVTESIADSMRISGATSAEASSSMIQLSQAMNAGFLSGQEFNSMADAAPRLLQAIRDSTGFLKKDLKELGSQGKITSAVMVRAFLDQSQALKKEADTLPDTFGKAMTQLANDATDAFGRADISSLTGAITELRGVITDPIFQKSMVSLATGVANVAKALAIAANEGTKLINSVAEDVNIAINGSVVIDPNDIEKLREVEKEITQRITAAQETYADGIMKVDFLSTSQGKALTAEAVEISKVIAAYEKKDDAKWQALQNGIVPDKPDEDDMGGFTPPEDDKPAKVTAIEKRIKALQQEADALGKTRQQVALKRLEDEGATTAELKAAEASLSRISAFKEAAEASDAADVKAQQRAEDLQGLVESLRTEEDVINDSYERRVQIVKDNLVKGSAQELDLMVKLDAERQEALKQLVNDSSNDMAEGFATRAKENIQDSIADAIINGVNDGGKGALESFGDLMLKMAAEAVAADIMNGIFNGGGMAGGIGGGDNTAGLIGGLGSLFAGFFDQGGNIPSGQFGIAGENGPEIIQGPANVTSTKDTAAAMNSGTSIGNINMSFPGVGNANEARIAAGQAAREINGIVGSSKRFA